MASAPPTNSPHPTLDVSSPTAIDSRQRERCVVIPPRSPRQATNYANSCSLRQRSERTSCHFGTYISYCNNIFFLPRNLEQRASVGNTSQPRRISHFGELRFELRRSHRCLTQVSGVRRCETKARKNAQLQCNSNCVMGPMTG